MLNNNKTKLRNCLAVTTLEAIFGCRETFQDNFELNPRLVSLYKSSRQRYMENFETAELIDI